MSRIMDKAACRACSTSVLPFLSVAVFCVSRGVCLLDAVDQARKLCVGDIAGCTIHPWQARGHVGGEMSEHMHVACYKPSEEF